MSCFIVSDKHLSAIVRWAEQYTTQPGKQQEAVNLLHAANVRSVNARYREDTPLDGAVYEPDAPLLSPIEVIKACDCLAYQCDNWEGFKGSEAQALILCIQAQATRELPGYANAKWSIQ